MEYYGTYQSTGIYSFEFLTKRGKTITEIVMMLPPESVTVTESQRSDLIPTIGGGYLCDYGNEFKDIQITGSLHFYYVGTRNNPLAFKPDANDTMVIDGYTEFIKLRYALIRYRDYTLTPNAKKNSPQFEGNALADVNALKSHVARKGNKLAPEVELVFHDYDYDEHFKVKVDRFSVSRDKSDPFTVRYDISLKAYEVYKGKGAQKTEVAKTAVEALLTNDELMQEFHTPSLPKQIPVTSPNDIVLPTPSREIEDAVIQDSELYVYNSVLQLYRAYYTWAIGMIRAGVLDVEKAMAGFSNPQMIEKFRSAQSE